jgi:hypothetical protein
VSLIRSIRINNARNVRMLPVVIFEYTPPATAAAGLPAQGEVRHVPDPDRNRGATDNIVAIHPPAKGEKT